MTLEFVFFFFLALIGVARRKKDIKATVIRHCISDSNLCEHRIDIPRRYARGHQLVICQWHRRCKSWHVSISHLFIEIQLRNYTDPRRLQGKNDIGTFAFFFISVSDIVCIIEFYSWHRWDVLKYRHRLEKQSDADMLACKWHSLTIRHVKSFWFVRHVCFN